MTIDFLTMAVAGGIVAAVSGCVLLAFWQANARADAALWWGLANLCNCMGLALWTVPGEIFGLPPLAFAPIVFNMAALLVWVAARVFNLGALPTPPALVGLLIGGLVCLMTYAIDGELSHSLSVATSSGFLIAAAAEFARGRNEVLSGRAMMISLLILHSAAVLLVGTEISTTQTSLSELRFNLSTLVHFEGLIFHVGAAICLVIMLKERSEIEHRANAMIDPLTGLANRRAFIETANRIIERGLRDGQPVSLVLFDLDKFKLINDTFGHATGDQVLQVFANVVSRVLRPSDVAGRIGGEEFVTIFAACDVESATAIATRIRIAFQSDGSFINGHAVNATASAGVSTISARKQGLYELMEAADQALYRAKTIGRNRVIIFEDDQPSRQSTVVRIA